MNKRIIEFVTATDAWCDQNLPSDWTDDVDKYLPVWNEKFAELIIQECVDRIKRVGILEDIKNETDMVVDAVKEHFGVE